MEGSKSSCIAVILQKNQESRDALDQIDSTCSSGLFYIACHLPFQSWNPVSYHFGRCAVALPFTIEASRVREGSFNPITCGSLPGMPGNGRVLPSSPRCGEPLGTRQ